MSTLEVTVVAFEEGGFLEYLQLQNGKVDLVTKSELINTVRKSGYSLSDRQLTFYTTEGLIPRSVRVGSRSGAYPSIVVNLMIWILQSRDEGVPIEALRELLPVWKLLIRACNEHRLSLGELEYVARQHVASTEGCIALPRVVSNVMLRRLCPDCRSEITIVHKDGTELAMSDASTTIGFAVARVTADNVEMDAEPQWLAATRITLAIPTNYSTDPTTVILGLGPNEALPPDPPPNGDGRQVSDKSEEVRM